MPLSTFVLFFFLAFVLCISLFCYSTLHFSSVSFSFPISVSDLFHIVFLDFPHFSLPQVIPLSYLDQSVIIHCSNYLFKFSLPHISHYFNLFALFLYCLLNTCKFSIPLPFFLTFVSLCSLCNYGSTELKPVYLLTLLILDAINMTKVFTRICITLNIVPYQIVATLVL